FRCLQQSPLQELASRFAPEGSPPGDDSSCWLGALYELVRQNASPLLQVYELNASQEGGNGGQEPRSATVAFLEGNVYTASLAAVELIVRRRGKQKNPPPAPEPGSSAHLDGLAVDEEDRQILRALAKRHPNLLTQDDIEVESKVSRRTISERMPALLRDGLAA